MIYDALWPPLVRLWSSVRDRRQSGENSPYTPCGCQSSSVEDQPQCPGLWHSSNPNARSLSHSPSAPPPSFTQSPYPPRSLVRDGQTSPHRPRLVVSRSTCPPLSSPPHANSFVIGPAVTLTGTGSLAKKLRAVLMCVLFGVHLASVSTSILIAPISSPNIVGPNSFFIIISFFFFTFCIIGTQQGRTLFLLL